MGGQRDCHFILQKGKSVTLSMATPGSGYEFPPQEVSWLQRDVLLFANSIGVKASDLHFLYVSAQDTSYLPSQ